MCHQYTNIEFTRYAVDRYLNIELQLHPLIKCAVRLGVDPRIRDNSLMIEKFAGILSVSACLTI